MEWNGMEWNGSQKGSPKNGSGNDPASVQRQGEILDPGRDDMVS